MAADDAQEPHDPYDPHGAQDDAGRGSPDQEAPLAPVPSRSRGLLRLRGHRAAGGDATGRSGASHGVVVQGGEEPDDDRLRRKRIRGFVALVADRIVDTAPRVPVRDLETLRRQFPGLGPEELADRLVSGALKGSATVGAGIGAAAMMPVPPAMPAELAAEMVGVASVEIKLIAELHEVYGRRPPGGLQQRAAAYVSSWTSERGIDISKPTTLNFALGGQLKRELRQRLLKRTVRNLPTLTPFMIGAAVGAVMNRRDTAKLADHIRTDLRRTHVPWSALPSGASPERA